MKNNFRKAALSTICMLIVAVMSLTGVTYAWFTAGEQATVNGMNVVVSGADGGVQVRAYNTTTWMTTLDINVAQTDVSPVSSADGVKFFNLGEKNPANAAEAKVVSVTKPTYDSTNTADDIIVKKIQLSNPGSSAVIVDLDGSSIKAADNGVANEIFKAARVALIVTYPTNDALGALSGTTVTYIYAAAEDTWNAFVATSDTYVPVNTAVTNVAVSTTTDTYDECLITLPANPDNANTAGIVDVEIVIWLEGQDADCKNANAAGAFDIVLNFKDVDAQ